MRLTRWGGGSMILEMGKPAKWMLMGLLAILALPVWVRGEDYQFATNGNAITITKYIGAGGAVAVPEKINGLAVTSIGVGAFAGCSSLTNVTIPNSVTNIGDYAFAVCTNLTKITIPNSITTIRDGTFQSCTNLTSITIPNRLTSIGNCAFCCCLSLTSVMIPNSVTNIGQLAFADSSLTSITIPNSVTTIGDGAFQNCADLTNLTIPKRVVSIGNRAFALCTNLTSVYFQGNAPIIGEDIFDDLDYYDPVTIYYLPTTTGWGKTFGGRPTAVWKQ